MPILSPSIVKRISSINNKSQKQVVSNALSKATQSKKKIYSPTEVKVAMSML